jgi:far upstream element-binding protein
MVVGPGALQITLDCPPSLVGRIIGKGGETIRDLQLKSGCQVQIDQNYPDGAMRKIQVAGQPQCIELAKQLIANVMSSVPGGSSALPLLGLAAAVGPEVSQIVECPVSVVGRVIGKGGETIKALQMQSGCKIQIDQNLPEGMPRKISVSGNAYAVAQAVNLINMKITEGGPGGMTDITPNVVLDCPKTLIGRVIGRGGETINDLQQRSGARIQIDQRVPEGQPCKVQISGNPQTTELAIRLVTDIINGGPTNGGGGGHGGGGMMPMMGGMGGMGMRGGYPPQQAAYGGYPPQQYGGYPPQQAAYGGYPPQQYGGYPPQQAAYGGYPQQAPPQQQPPPAKSVWSEHDDGSGNKYWYNAVTGASQWERPIDA